MHKKINLGCGIDEILKDYINIDKYDFGQEIIRDIEKGVPFPDNSVDEVRCHHTLEHIDDIIFVFNEIWRVCKNGAKVDIEVPCFPDNSAVETWTHKRFFTSYSFEQLTDYEGNPNKEKLIRYRQAEGLKARFKILKKEIKGEEGMREIHIILEAMK